MFHLRRAKNSLRDLARLIAAACLLLTLLPTTAPAASRGSCSMLSIRGRQVNSVWKKSHTSRTHGQVSVEFCKDLTGNSYLLTSRPTRWGRFYEAGSEPYEVLLLEGEKGTIVSYMSKRSSIRLNFVPEGDGTELGGPDPTQPVLVITADVPGPDGESPYCVAQPFSFQIRGGLQCSSIGTD